MDSRPDWVLGIHSPFQRIWLKRLPQEIHTLHLFGDSFRIQSPGIYFCCIQLFSSSILFPNSPTHKVCPLFWRHELSKSYSPHNRGSPQTLNKRKRSSQMTSCTEGVRPSEPLGTTPTVTEQKPSLQRNSAVFANACSMPVQHLPATPLEGLESWPKPRRTRTEQLRRTIVRRPQWPARPTCHLPLRVRG